MCDENRQPKQNDMENSLLIITTTDSYEILIEVNNLEQKASILDSFVSSELEQNIVGSITMNNEQKIITPTSTITLGATVSGSKIEKVELFMGETSIYAEENLKSNHYQKNINLGIPEIAEKLEFYNYQTAILKIITTSGQDKEIRLEGIRNYTIATEKSLKDFATIVNNGEDFQGKTVYLVQDITSVTDHNPIGYFDGKGNWTGKPFSGTFEGENHTITISSLNASNKGNGLFGMVIGGTIRKVNVYGSSSVNTIFGGIAGGIKEGIISNCTNNYTVLESNASECGGIVGICTNATIENCINRATIHGYTNVGGRANTNSKIQNCLNISDIYQEGQADVNLFYANGTKINNDLIGVCGGIVGRLENSIIEKCVNTNTATVYGLENNLTKSYVAGGIVGLSEKNSTITNCQNNGNLMRNPLSTKKDGYDYIGGIGGYIQETTIDQCFNTGTISGKIDTTYYGASVGGILGEGRESNIYNCYNKGSVYGKRYAGGIIGGFSGSAEEKNNNIYNCYNATSDLIASTVGTYIGWSSYLQGDNYVAVGNPLGARTNPTTDTWGKNGKVYNDNEAWDGSEIFTYMNQGKGKDLWEFENGVNDNLPYLKNNRP